MITPTRDKSVILARIERATASDITPLIGTMRADTLYNCRCVLQTLAAIRWDDGQTERDHYGAWLILHSVISALEFEGWNTGKVVANDASSA